MLLLCLMFLTGIAPKVVAVEIEKKEGQAVIFQLPPVGQCGPYRLSNPQSRDIVFVRNASYADIYLNKYRSDVTFLENRTVLFTMHHLSAAADEGTYIVTSDSPSCTTSYYTLSITKEYDGIAYWVKWGSWAQCDRSCGPGTRIRKRKCSVPSHCSTGSAIETDDCENNPQCQLTAVWLTWGSWSRCDTSCGPGRMTRTRLCTIDGKCGTESGHETTVCSFNPPCQPTVDAVWLTWGSWSRCDTSCGPGRMTRTRKCSIDGKCGNERGHEIRACSSNTQCQSTASTWSEWTDWSRCSVTCDWGYKTRNRKCTDSNMRQSDYCSGEAFETTPCAISSCRVYLWSEWMSWSLCTKPCGMDMQIRQRECLDDYNRRVPGRCIGDSSENKTCDLPLCKDLTSGNAQQEKDGEASVAVPLSGIVGVAAGLFILILFVVIVALVLRLRRKREVVRAVIDPNRRGIHYSRKKSSTPSSSSFRKSEHVYAEIDDDDIYKKTDKSMSIVTIDNPYSDMPSSGTPKSGDQGPGNDQVVYNNNTGHVFMFETPRPSQVRLDEAGYLAPVISKTKQVKYTK